MAASCNRRRAFVVVATVVVLTSSLDVEGFYDIDDSVLHKVNWIDPLEEMAANPSSKEGATMKLNIPGSLVEVGDPHVLFVESDDDGGGLGQLPLVVGEDVGDGTSLSITSRHQESYVCQIPGTRDGGDHQPGGDANAERGSYDHSRTPLDLLEPLLTAGICAIRIEQYWEYELCHGSHVRQYHEEKHQFSNGEADDGRRPSGSGGADEGSSKPWEFYLGRFNQAAIKSQKQELKEYVKLHGRGKKPPKKQLDNFNLPYFEILMKDGTLCDLTGSPRFTRVRYVCYPAGRNEIYSLKETSSCQYEVVVVTPLLCAHPDYRPESAAEKNINCRPASDNAAHKPLDLISQELENLRTRTIKPMYEAKIVKENQKTSIFIKPVKIPEHLLDSKVKAAPNPPLKPLSDPEVVKDFLMGKYCLYGGSGWWKFEFCFGKKVEQFHEATGQPRTVINLGRFDKQKHIEWLTTNPSKAPKPLPLRKQLSYLYSDGDFCKETGKNRRVEVKLKCSHAESLSAVSLYLAEPATCQYILGVESPIICDILSRADQYGLMELSKTDFSLGGSENKDVDPSSESSISRADNGADDNQETETGRLAVSNQEADDDQKDGKAVMYDDGD